MTEPVVSDEITAVDDDVRQSDRADAPVSVVTERFLRAIIATVPLDQIEEIHLFSPLRSGSSETGIAVIAAREELVSAVPVLELGLEGDADAKLKVSAEQGAVDTGPYADDAVALLPSPLPIPSSLRHTISTARYRLAIKGPDRGKWETDVVAEAEAPLVTVEMVVRGVQRRAGEDSAITRFSAAQVAHALRIDLPAV